MVLATCFLAWIVWMLMSRCPSNQVATKQQAIAQQEEQTAHLFEVMCFESKHVVPSASPPALGATVTLGIRWQIVLQKVLQMPEVDIRVAALAKCWP